jgi:carboxyl-terminal processing protease
MTDFTPRTPGRAAMLALAFTLASCGGGGGDSGGGIPPSSFFEGQLVQGDGTRFSDWNAATCSDERQKNWVRSNLNEDYLFYSEAPLDFIDPASFAGTVPELFDAYTVDGVPQKDVFSFVITQAEADAAFLEGSATSVGITLRRDPATAQIRIAIVDPNGPAAPAGLLRGMQLQTVNGTALATNSNGQPALSQAQFNALFASPPGTPVTLGLSTPPSTAVSTVTLTTATFGETPVPTATVLVNPALPGEAVGYLAHHSFITPVAEVQLADAFRTFSDAQVTDLVVDLRYNGGGYIYMAAQLGYMVAGSLRTNGRTFESFVFNDKRSGENVSQPFVDRIQPFFPEGQARAGEALATLNLSRVIVLSTGETCSASEAFVSALRGVNVEVVLVGSTTCGKPYGFSQENNCSLAYFPLEFEGRNHLGDVVPVTGLTPTCAATDDLDHALGDANEGMLASALFYVESGSCPFPSAQALSRARPRALGQAVPELEFTPRHRSIQLRRK